jgi:Ger(x)C family germination protein
MRVGMVAMLLLTTACGDYRPIETSFNVVAIGIDTAGGDGQGVKVTVIGADFSKKKLRLQAQGKTVMDAIQSMQAMTSKTVVLSHIETILFARSVAKAGLDRVLDVFLRNIQIRTDTMAVIVKGKAADYFDGKKIKTPITGRTYAYQIRTSSVQFDPHMANLHSLMLNATVGDGNYSLPYLALRKKQKIVVMQGFALCKHGKLELVLSMNETPAFLILRRTITSQSFSLNSLGTSLHFRYATPHVHVKWVGRTVHATYLVWLKDEVLEQVPLRKQPMNNASLLRVQHAASAKIAQQCEQIAAKLQRHKLDVIWLAEPARVANPHRFQATTWDETFTKAIIHVHIHLRVERSGQLF